MTETDEICSVRSVSLYVRQIRWLEENVGNRSELVRMLLDAHIESTEGYARAIKSLEARHARLLEELRGLDGEMAVLVAKQEEFERERLGERESRVRRLREELNVG
tara:strand:+ start:50 stop:367 length:318 start_codon:yes stop_codon:yes gene_type:complete